jgi:nitroimidazol reductase NimA-like FMN-containing flavoprotein (pyridoxamine 5'-phosphate oxidase superfamily)
VEHLSRQECADLLAQHHVGRVAFPAPDGTHLLPVSYVFWAGSVVFRTSPTGVLSALADRSKVAFEIDEIDVHTGDAWDVELRGATRRIWDAEELEPLWRHPQLTPWMPDVRPVVIAIEPESMTGRRIWHPVAE